MNFNTKLNRALTLLEEPLTGAIEAALDEYIDRYNNDIPQILDHLFTDLRNHYTPQLNQIRITADKARKNTLTDNKAHIRHCIKTILTTLESHYQENSDPRQTTFIFRSHSWALQDLNKHLQSAFSDKDRMNDPTINQFATIINELQDYYHKIADSLWDQLNRPGPSRP